MPTLRLTQSTAGDERIRIEAALEDGPLRQVAVAEFTSLITPQDREDLRWYLEDYLQHDADPAPEIAARIETRIAGIGVDLFKAVFQAEDDARDLWAKLRDRIEDTRIEIVSEVQEEVSLPWELLRDPKTGTPLSLSAQAFVRAAHRAARQPRLTSNESGPIRILLVICRPGGSDDVPFRSVASRLIKALGGREREAVELDVLRPPTFEQLSKVLRGAKKNGTPYHVVHFDGHGTYTEVNEQGGALKDEFASLVLSPPRPGQHGYLLFENPAVEENLQFVDGPALGRLLIETSVQVLVLNACRSAHAEAPSAPDASSPVDLHTQVRAFGSLAQEAIDLGVAGVVAMRYNVYVVTAAQFVADLYESLADGQTLGEAVTLGRKQLEAQPLRELAYEPRPLQDWMVPIVHEATPVALFPKPVQKAALKITVSADAVTPGSRALGRELEQAPDVGFFGRDETLLALDRAFDTQKIVLLHAYAGSGKTSTAAEFARWYHLTGGIDGPVLFTSFEQHKTLEQVLNESIGRTFDASLEAAGIHWLTLSADQRREVALEVLSQIPVLWIWDNVEPISGFPAGTQSAWSEEEQKELADFVRAANKTQAKFLLTSRREERNWLGDLPARIHVPPMPMQERVQLARALAARHHTRLHNVDDWMPLLRFTRGNPLTITVLVRQALRSGWKTRAQIEAFVERLKIGEAAFEDEAEEGRDRSLGASLNYGFENAFNKAELKQLAVLYLFQGFVDVDVLQFMADPQNRAYLEELDALNRQAWIVLLDRAADIGLLMNHGDGYFSIHPALPWFLKALFESYYPGPATVEESPHTRAIRSYTSAMNDVGDFYCNRRDNAGVMLQLEAQEANFNHARHLARMYGWFDKYLGNMQGLRALYWATGRRAEW